MKRPFEYLSIFVTIVGTIIALAALIVALLNWLSPFNPVGNSPIQQSPPSVPTSLISPPIQVPGRADETPIREHYQVSVGDGIFTSGTFSDGLAPYSESWLQDNNHFKIQRIRPEENPN